MNHSFEAIRFFFNAKVLNMARFVEKADDVKTLKLVKNDFFANFYFLTRLSSRDRRVSQS